MDALDYRTWAGPGLDTYFNEKCGPLIYIPNVPTDISYQITVGVSTNVLTFKMKADTESLVGLHTMTVLAKSKLVKKAPTLLVTLEYEILPCFVYEYSVGSQVFHDLDLAFG